MSRLNKILFGAVIVLLVLLCLFADQYIKAKTKAIRFENNYSRLAIEKRQAEELANKEFAKYCTEIDSLRQELKIKKGKVKDYIEIKYNVKDSTVVKTILVYDSVFKISTFDFKRPFYHIAGGVNKDSAFLKNVEFSDKLSAFIYSDKEPFERWLFIPKFWKKRTVFLTAKVYSEYKRDTVLVSRQIHIK